MKKYWSFFTIRFQYGLQYRAAAWAGVATQFVWGGLTILMFAAFYKSGANAFPMTMAGISNYIWLQQAFLGLFMAWFFDKDIFNAITSGSVAYELCRPIDTYWMWFTKNISIRLSRTVLRCVPILIIAPFLPAPYGLTLPQEPLSLALFGVSMVLGFLVLISFLMLIYISTFYTLSPLGVRMLAISVVEFFSGMTIPLPFFPESLQPLLLALPFASMQSTPFLIYSGTITGGAVFKSILLQIFWLAALIAIGRLLMKNALRKAVIQGG